MSISYIRFRYTRYMHDWWWRAWEIIGRDTKPRFAILRPKKKMKIERKIFFPPFFLLWFSFSAFEEPMGFPHVSPWTPQLDYNCKNWASSVGLTTFRRWAPSIFNRLATSTYLCTFSGSASPFGLGFDAFLFSVVNVGGPSAARDGSHTWPKRVPLVMNSWARYPASSWLLAEGGGGCSKPLVLVAVRAVGSKPALGLSGLRNFVAAAAVTVEEALSLSKPSSLSLRLLLLFVVTLPLALPVGVNTRRGGRRIVLVFMAIWLHDTSATKLHFKIREKINGKHFQIWKKKKKDISQIKKKNEKKKRI